MSFVLKLARSVAIGLASASIVTIAGKLGAIDSIASLALATGFWVSTVFGWRWLRVSR
jgi:hypothetical protein